MSCASSASTVTGKAGTATGSERAKKKNRVIAVPDLRTSSVIVSADRELMEQIAEMVRRFYADVAQDDLLARWFRNIGSVGNPVLDTPVFFKSSDGVSDFTVPDIRADVADWNGDGLPDIVTGSFSGSVMVSLNVGTRSLPRFAPSSVLVDSAGRSFDGSYNLNARIVDVTGDGVPDLVSTFNWGTINCHANLGSASLPILADALEFQVTDSNGDRVNFHALADGAIVDFADLDRDGTVDLVAGGENSGALFLAYGRGGMDSLVFEGLRPGAEAGAGGSRSVPRPAARLLRHWVRRAWLVQVSRGRAVF